jgi:hypothetical protein
MLPACGSENINQMPINFRSELNNMTKEMNSSVSSADRDFVPLSCSSLLAGVAWAAQQPTRSNAPALGVDDRCGEAI